MKRIQHQDEDMCKSTYVHQIKSLN